MEKQRVFISFDYDHDVDLKNLLIGQSKNPDSPFEIIDMSIKESILHNWQEYARFRIKRCDVVIVICGEHTDSAKGIDLEIKISNEENKPYYLLKGRADKLCLKPKSSRYYDKLWPWTWDNLKLLFEKKSK